MLFNVIYYILYALSIVGIFAVALLVYSKRKEDEYKYFAIFAALLNVWLIFQFSAQVFAGTGTMDATLLLRASVATGPFFAIYFLFFATRYVGIKVKKTKHTTANMQINFIKQLKLKVAHLKLRGAFGML